MVSCLEDVVFFLQIPSATQEDGSIFFWKNFGDANFSQVDIPTTGDSQGTGFQSIASLQELPVNVSTLKIRYGGSGALRTLRFCQTTTTTMGGGNNGETTTTGGGNNGETTTTGGGNNDATTTQPGPVTWF